MVGRVGDENHIEDQEPGDEHAADRARRGVAAPVPQLRYFSRTHRCVAYAARGYPPSDVPTDPSAYSQARAVADAVAVLDGSVIEDIREALRYAAAVDERELPLPRAG